MTWAGSTRRSRLPPGWSSTIQPRILARDGHRCYRCGGLATEVDHKDRTRGDEDENLGAICRQCHGRKSALEGVAAKDPRRPKEQHPGLR